MADPVDVLKDKIIAAIEDEIERRGMSQTELGKLVGMTRTNVNGVLRGTGKAVSFKRLIEMADVLGLEVDVKIRRKR